MKRLLLVLALPCLMTAGEKPKETTTQEDIANKTGGAMIIGGGIYGGVTLVNDICLSLSTGNLWGIPWAFGKGALHTATLASTTVAVTEMINPENPLEAEARKSALRLKAAEDTAALEFSTCLNTHAKCREVNARGIPRRCVSPVFFKHV